MKKLRDNDLLNLIPQCKYKFNENKPETIAWHFYGTNREVEAKRFSSPPKRTVVPGITEKEIDALIKKAKHHVEGQPKKDPTKFTLPELETRKMYARAYKYWTDREIEIMNRAYKKFKRVDKVAELLKRRPHIVREKLNGKQQM